MTTECTTERLEFERFRRQRVVGRFDGGELGSEQEMTELLGAGKSERTSSRSGYRAGYYERSLVTRVGSIELRVPQDREGRFSTSVFERYQRSEKALVAAMAEMYFQGVSTRKVKAVTEELCGSVAAGCCCGSWRCGRGCSGG